MQRWMEQKIARAKIVGVTRSGCNRATGGVFDDFNPRDGRDRTPKPVSKRAPKVKRLAKEDRPVPFGKGRKAKRAVTHRA